MEIPDAAINVDVGQYCVVEFVSKKSKALYVGKVIAKEENEDAITVEFYRRSGNLWVKPPQLDVSEVDMEQIKMLLPEPLAAGGTSRSKHALNFGIELPGNVK